MIVVMKSDATEAEILKVTDRLVQKGMQVQTNHGIDCTVLGVLGDTYTVDKERIGLMGGVERVVSVQEPFKKANRKFHPEDSVIDVDGIRIGDGDLKVMAGPCSVESTEQLTCVAQSIQKSGAQILRGGAFKPRTSPYAFQGLGEQGLDILVNVRDKVHMPIVTEIMAPRYVELFAEKVDMIQIGARNMQNLSLIHI